MIRVAHVITGLDLGGAEMVLFRLLEETDRQLFDPHVISLSTQGPIAAKIEEIGVPVRSLGFSNLFSMAVVVPRLARSLRRLSPDVVQTWMYHADLIGGTTARVLGMRNVAWGLHAGPLPPNGGSRLMRAGLNLGARLSGSVPRTIVCCSKETRDVHVQLGYDAKKMLVIQNGFVALPASLDARASVRNELGETDDIRLIGRVGRFHPQKDHETFLDALRHLTSDSSWSAVMVGSGLTPSNLELVAAVDQRGLRGRVHLLGPRDDVPRLNAAFDVAVSSSSYGEGLPIVLGEAIAAGTPVVTTDVGDSAELVGDADRVVPPGDGAGLAEAIRRILRMDLDTRKELAIKEQQRLLERYGVAAMADAYADLHERLASS